MDFDQYQEQAMKTAIYKKQDSLIYSVLGASGEAGEVAGKMAKIIRDSDGVVSDEARLALIKETGDLLWMCAALSDALGTNLNLVAIQNIQKLQKRKEDGTLSGSGDDR